MALNPSNGSNLEQLALKGLKDACELQAEGVLKLFQNYFSECIEHVGKYSPAAIKPLK